MRIPSPLRSARLFRGSLPLRIVLAVVFGGAVVFGTTVPSAPIRVGQGTSTARATSSLVSEIPERNDAPLPPVVRHMLPPSAVKAAYMTSCIASGKGLRAPLVRLVEETELNALVIDIKDYTGTISFDAKDPRFVYGTKGCPVSDMKDFIAELHEKDIYVIGRVTVMQDATYPKSHPDAAVKRASDGATWKDKKGLTFIDPGATEYWEYMVDLGKASYAIGFDEINYDYIRFPSDGNMRDIAFLRTGSSTKPAMMRKFYTYLGAELRKAGIPSSADLFGMTTTNTDDLGIGQVLEDALLHFDYVAPMVYPSHYPPTFNGWQNPNDVPGPIVRFAMTRAVERANAMEEKEWRATLPPALVVQASGTAGLSASSTPKFTPTGKYAQKLRPWLQDFDYGGDYDAADVRAQIQATYDAGLTSWMVWDPNNRYTSAAYLGK